MSRYERIQCIEESETSFIERKAESQDQPLLSAEQNRRPPYDGNLGHQKRFGLTWGTIWFFLGLLVGGLTTAAACMVTFSPVLRETQQMDCSLRSSHHHSPGNALPLISAPGDKAVLFAPNLTFSLSPDEDGSTAAWETVIPDGMGLVQHEVLGPEIAGLAFVHQLHCVQRIREGYYSALVNGTRNSIDSAGEDAASVHHVRHCFDYLRQALMCHGDTNLEYRGIKKDTGELGTSGWTMHHCRDFSELHDFAEKWKVWHGKARIQQTRITEEENVPGRVINYDYISSLCPDHEACCLKSPEEMKSPKRRCTVEGLGMVDGMLAGSNGA